MFRRLFCVFLAVLLVVELVYADDGAVAHDVSRTADDNRRAGNPVGGFIEQLMGLPQQFIKSVGVQNH